MEYIDILDQEGKRTGEIKSRVDVHRNGDWHKTVHIWVLNSNDGLMLQLRSSGKSSSPSLWDISVAGHLIAGEDSRSGALREVREELGLELEEEQLEYLFTIKRQGSQETGVHVNNEFSDVFLVEADINAAELRLQKEEVSAIKFVHFKKLEYMVRNQHKNISIKTEEYEKLFQVLRQRIGSEKSKSGNMKKVTVRSKDGTRLEGILQFPTISTNRCVVLCHGLGTDKDEYGNYILLAERFIQSGYSVFRFDFRAHGNSEGIDYEMTVEKEVEDLNAAMRYVESEGYAEINLLGSSFSGGVCVLYAAANQKHIARLILWNPVIDYKTAFERKGLFAPEVFSEIKRIGYQERKSGTTGKIFKLGARMFEDAAQLKPQDCLDNLDIPILFVHGTEDESVLYEWSLSHLKKCRFGALETIEGADHGFHNSDKSLRYAIDATIGFFLSNHERCI